MCWRNCEEVILGAEGVGDGGVAEVRSERGKQMVKRSGFCRSLRKPALCLTEEAFGEF